MTERRWKPSNSSDGIYMEEICVRCANDAAFRDGTGDSCEIAARMYREGETAEWLLTETGGVKCTAFLAEGEKQRCTATPDMFTPPHTGDGE